jgi:hypothetical protein
VLYDLQFVLYVVHCALLFFRGLCLHLLL